MRYLFFTLAFLAANASAAPPQVFEATCAGAKFRVTSVSSGHPLNNTYVLAAVTSSGARDLFKSEVGGWFHAACLRTEAGKAILLFQSYCGGSRCLEGNYGAIEPSSLQSLLKPSPGNTENRKQASVILGFDVPHLGSHKGAFCCGQ